MCNNLHTLKDEILFQFPSSGKLLPNEDNVDNYQNNGLKFQFPSSGKLLPNELKEMGYQITVDGFNSLQAGNFFQTPYKIFILHRE